MNLSGSREIQIAVDGDHSSICKFDDAKDDGYIQIENNLVEMAKKALALAGNRIPDLVQGLDANPKPPISGDHGDEQAQLNGRDDSILEQNKRISVGSEMTPDEQSGFKLPLSPASTYFQLTMRFEAVLQSLFFSEMDLRAYGIEEAAENTCQWVFDDPVFNEWSMPKSTLLWIKGKPGAGKSTLMKHLVSATNTGTRHVDEIVASFFLNGRGAIMEKCHEGLFRSLLHQLLRFSRNQLQRLSRIYKDQCQTRGTYGKWSWCPNQLQGYLTDLLLELSAIRPVRVFVDALDEIGEKRAVELVQYFDSVVNKSSAAKRTLSVCFSCRHYPIIALHGLRICVEDQNAGDITTFVRQQFRSNRIDEEKTQVLSKDVIEYANGVFQWVKVVLPVIFRMCRQGHNIETIQEKLGVLPRQLHDLYSSILNAIPAEARQESLHLMRWISFSFRPFTLQEARHIIALDPTSNWGKGRDIYRSTSFVRGRSIWHRITDLSGGLVEIRGERHPLDDSGRLQFIHTSVKEFLIENSGLEILESTSIGDIVPRGHFYLAKSCVRYLEEGTALPFHRLENETSYAKDSKYKLLDYAAVHWIRHAALADMTTTTHPRVVELLDHLFTGHQPADRLSTLVALYQRFHVDLSMPRSLSSFIIHWLAYFNMAGILEAFVDRQLKRGTGAIQNVSTDVTSKFIPLWGDVDFEFMTRDYEGHTPLALAARCNNIASVIQLLRCPTVHPNTADYVDGTTPLGEAVDSGNEEIIQLFASDSRTDLNMPGKWGMRPIELVLRKGMFEVANTLIDVPGFNSSQFLVETIRRPDSDFIMADWRPGHNSVERVEWLLSSPSIDINYRSEATSQSPALYWAVVQDRMDIATLILELRGDELDQEVSIIPAYEVAKARGNVALVKILKGRVKAP